MSGKPVIINASSHDFLGRRWMKFLQGPEINYGLATCDICLKQVRDGYLQAGKGPTTYVCTEHVYVRLQEYYVTKEKDLYVLRQSRYMGVDHPHDVCAFARTLEEMRGVCEKFFRGAVDFSEVEEENAEEI